MPSCPRRKLIAMVLGCERYGGGAGVSEKKWNKFLLCLEQTRETLLKCAEKLSGDPTPFNQRFLNVVLH